MLLASDRLALIMLSQFLFLSRHRTEKASTCDKQADVLAARSFFPFVLSLSFLALRVVDFSFISLHALVVLRRTVCMLSILLSRSSLLFVTYKFAVN